MSKPYWIFGGDITDSDSSGMEALGFIPITQEDYDIVVEQKNYVYEEKVINFIASRRNLTYKHDDYVQLRELIDNYLKAVMTTK